MKAFHPDRRKFLKLGVAMAGSSLVLGVNWSCSSGDQGDAEPAADFRPNAWLRIDPNGRVIISVAEAEMGQGTYTALPMIIAEELDIDWQSVRVEHASLDPVYGYQTTGGSTSVREGWTHLRKAGAIARQMLLIAGAASLDVPASVCRTESGRVIHTLSGRSVPYKNLIGPASRQLIPSSVQLKEYDDFRLIGRPLPRTDIPAKVNGSARFGMDTQLPGMLYATIVHCPVFGGRVKKIDTADAEKIQGVKEIFQIDEGVVVVATDTWTAFKAKDALNIDWDPGNKASLSTDKIIQMLRGFPEDQAEVAWERGSMPDKPVGEAKTITAEYILPPEAHVAMEPINCTAQVRDDGGFEIWAPTQSPSGAYDTAQALVQSQIQRGLKKVQKKLFGTHDESIEVHTTLLGGGFGRRLKQDYVAEVVQIAQRVDKPVQLVWTREEDVQHDFYHPLTRHEMRGSLDDNGIPVAWEHTIGGPKVSAGGTAPLPYSIPNVRVRVKDLGEIIPRGPWRSVSPHYNVFAMEHFLDELAHAGRQDPVELRLKLLGNHPRLRKVLEVAADSVDWPAQRPGNRWLGLAAAADFGSQVAEIVELWQTEKQGFKVHKVTCVIDCGLVINPDIVKQQMEGSIIFGLTAALKSKITLQDGRVQQSNYHNYPILRLDETPEIEVILLRNEEAPGGVGEPGVPPLAPALANAILAATGKSAKGLPMDLTRQQVQ